MNSKNSLIGKSEIYMVINNITGKRYIGQTQCYGKRGNCIRKLGIQVRWSGHCSDAKRNIQGRGAKCLIDSIQKYGKDNHIIKPIFICPTYQANYWEVKYIRQYNTQVPNGMNIEKGGKKAPLAEETKKKLSESKKGKYVGEKNPMWGKHHSKKTVEKIKDALKGKPLRQECKENMSKSHKLNMEKGILPPRRKYSELPKYIYHIVNSKKEGYEIRNHPKLK